MLKQQGSRSAEGVVYYKVIADTLSPLVPRGWSLQVDTTLRPAKSNLLVFTREGPRLGRCLGRSRGKIKMASLIADNEPPLLVNPGDVLGVCTLAYQNLRAKAAADRAAAREKGQHQ